MARPPITITCECGEVKRVAYGQRWRCEKCGRTWNTQQIPAEEYDSLLRRMKRHKLEAIGSAIVFAAVLIPLVVYSPRFITLVPLLMAGWLFLFLPYWRRRYRRSAHDTPRWQLEPE